MSSDISFLVSYLGASHELTLPPDSQLGTLAELLAERCGVAPTTVKLLGGKAGLVKLAERPERTLQEAGIVTGAKLKMMASPAEAVAAVQAGRDLPGLAPLEHELAREVRRGMPSTGGEPAPPTSPYTFQRFEAWERPGLHPAPSEALKLLRRLAADPGIVAVMARHRWSVGLLSEMPPEGKVGVSPVCVLGVNINRGQEISLRLRTDDLKGFRRYDRIVETLIHELAHMVHGDHDDAFKQLNSQLRAEVAAADWRGAAARRLEGVTAYEGTVRYDLPAGEQGAMAETARLSGKSLRELAGAAAAPVLPQSARSAAAQAALQRAQQAGAERQPLTQARADGGAVPARPPQPPAGQQPPLAVRSVSQPLRKGELAWYRQRDGSWVPTKVVHVDHSVQPPSYGIALGTDGAVASDSGDGQYRETEAHRLLPRRDGEAGLPRQAGWGAVEEVEGLGHHDEATEAKEEAVRRQLEQ